MTEPTRLRIIGADFSPEGYARFTIDRPGHITLSDVRLIEAAPALLAFATWAVSQFQGDSGAGEAHWEQYPQYTAGRAAIANATGEQP